MTFPKAYADRVARFRVPGGFVLIAAFALLSRPSWESIGWGAVLALPGLALRAWAAGHLEKNQKLTTSGPYAYLRNPLYAGSLVVAAGMVVAARSWPLGAVFAAVFMLVYLPVIQLEEQHLRELFPEFAAYAARVPLLTPRFPGLVTPGRFRWLVFRRNEEYKAAGAFLLGVLLLVLKNTCR
jgi:protein-S-isoprenylcysteine O-methyltransferase Ste14